MIWNKNVECMPREQMRELQGEKLRRIVAHAYRNSPFYKKRFDEHGVHPDDIHTIDDIVKLPFTVKQDLRDNYPFGLMAVPMTDIIRLHASSGTTGKPIVVGYTQKDLDNWSEAVARCLTAYGLGHDDLIQISYGYGLFTGGLGVHAGVQKIGATVIPTSSGNTQKQIQLMQDFGTTALACTPSYAMYMAEEINKMGIPKERFKLKVGIFGAEPWTNAMRHEIQDKLHLKAFDIYGLTEISGPGAGGECECQNGTHIWEDLFYPEIIDPATLQPVEPGQKGELVFTTLDKWGMPMIRYRTRDLTSLNYDKCDCGRTCVRMGKILGRSDDMLIIRGVNIFPSQIETVLMEQGYPANYQIIVDRVNHSDTLEVLVEMTPDSFSDSLSKITRMEQTLVAALKEMLGIVVKVRLVAPKSIERSEGKAVRIIDKRKI